MSVSVADELFFEHWLESLSPMQRAGVDRVLTSRGYNEARISRFDLDSAEEKGYRRGVEVGRAEQKPPRDD